MFFPTKLSKSDISSKSFLFVLFGFCRPPSSSSLLCLLLTIQIVFGCFCKSTQASLADSLSKIDLYNSVCLQGGFDAVVFKGESSKVLFIRNNEFVEFDIEPNIQTIQNVANRRVRRKSSSEVFPLCSGNKELGKLTSAFYLGKLIFLVYDNNLNLTYQRNATTGDTSCAKYDLIKSDDLQLDIDYSKVFTFRNHFLFFHGDNFFIMQTAGLKATNFQTLSGPYSTQLLSSQFPRDFRSMILIGQNIWIITGDQVLQIDYTAFSTRFNALLQHQVLKAKPTNNCKDSIGVDVFPELTESLTLTVTSMKDMIGDCPTETEILKDYFGGCFWFKLFVFLTVLAIAGAYGYLYREKLTEWLTKGYTSVKQCKDCKDCKGCKECKECNVKSFRQCWSEPEVENSSPV